MEPIFRQATQVAGVCAEFHPTWLLSGAEMLYRFARFQAIQSDFRKYKVCGVEHRGFGRKLKIKLRPSLDELRDVPFPAAQVAALLHHRGPRRRLPAKLPAPRLEPERQP